MTANRNQVWKGRFSLFFGTIPITRGPATRAASILRYMGNIFIRLSPDSCITRLELWMGISHDCWPAHMRIRTLMRRRFRGWWGLGNCQLWEWKLFAIVFDHGPTLVSGMLTWGHWVGRRVKGRDWGWNVELTKKGKPSQSMIAAAHSLQWAA